MIKFVQAQLSDKGSILDLMSLYYEYDGLAFERRRAEEALSQLMKAPQLGEVWLIKDEESERVIGYFALVFSFSLECGGPEAFIDELFILDEFRGKGIGTHALDHAFSRCTSNGMKAVRLEVTDDNIEALTLYKKKGFEDLDRYLLRRHLKTI